MTEQVKEQVKKVHLRRRLNKSESRYSLLVIAIPAIVSLYVILSGMLFNIQAFTLGLLIVSYCLTVFGVTVGFHRLLTHKSFKTHRVIKIILCIFGIMAYEGPVFFWTAAHRRHHKYPDKENDPHSPINYAGNPFKAFFHAHIGWMLNHRLEDWRHYIPDLIADKDLRALNKHYVPIALSGLVIPGIINGLYYMSWYHFIEGVFVCGFFRVFLQHHVTWSINSVCHLWGRKDFNTEDNSKNNIVFGVFALGEGWHNGHHAFPTSAKHGLIWWQLDVSYCFIKLLSLVGLAHSIKLPSQEKILLSRRKQLLTSKS